MYEVISNWTSSNTFYKDLIMAFLLKWETFFQQYAYRPRKFIHMCQGSLFSELTLHYNMHTEILALRMMFLQSAYSYKHTYLRACVWERDLKLPFLTELCLQCGMYVRYLYSSVPLRLWFDFSLSLIKFIFIFIDSAFAPPLFCFLALPTSVKKNHESMQFMMLFWLPYHCYFCNQTRCVDALLLITRHSASRVGM